MLTQPRPHRCPRDTPSNAARCPSVTPGLDASMAHKARERHAFDRSTVHRQGRSAAEAQVGPSVCTDGLTRMCGAPKGIRNLTWECQQGFLRPAACRIVAGQAACAVSDCSKASQPDSGGCGAFPAHKAREWHGPAATLKYPGFSTRDTPRPRPQRPGERRTLRIHTNIHRFESALRCPRIFGLSTRRQELTCRPPEGSTGSPLCEALSPAAPSAPSQS